MYACMCGERVCMYACMCAMCACTCAGETCVYVCMYACMCAHVQVRRVYVCMHVCTCVGETCVYICMHACVHVGETCACAWTMILRGLHLPILYMLAHQTL